MRWLTFLLLLFSGQAHGQNLANVSFLLEEAWKGEESLAQKSVWFDGELWSFALYAEWTTPATRHTASASVPFEYERGSSARGGDLSLDYRFHVLDDRDGRVALAPRLSLLSVPSGEGSGRERALEAMVPLTVIHSQRLVTHWNVSARWTGEGSGSLRGTTVRAAAGVAKEAGWGAVVVAEAAAEHCTEEPSRDVTWTISPAIRFPRTIGGLQIVPGIAFPLTAGRGEPVAAGAVAHVLIEVPFRRAWAD
jgi:hypothetical protein